MSADGPVFDWRATRDYFGDAAVYRDMLGVFLTD